MIFWYIRSFKIKSQNNFRNFYLNIISAFQDTLCVCVCVCVCVITLINIHIYFHISMY